MTSTVGLPVSRQQAEQWSFVLGAVNIPSIIEFEQHSWVVKVSPVHAKRALQEIAAYVEEESDWPPNRPAPKVQKLVFSKYQPPTILMMGGLVAFYLFTGPWSLKSGWFVNGAVSGRQILENGEWWRLVTALTLHADVMHIFGNVLIGGVLVHLLCRLLGNGLGWFLILVSGILGNFLNVFLRGYMHNSVGFSTAIFGTIGILAGYQAVRKRTTAARDILLPLAAGGGLLAFLGTGGQRTDLGAHFFGLLVGIALGAALVFLPAQRILVTRTTLQSVLFVATLLIIQLSWWLAMA
jgi:membrane associated rhomboid family serine protease